MMEDSPNIIRPELPQEYPYADKDARGHEGIEESALFELHKISRELSLMREQSRDARNFVALRGGSDGPAGLLLAINPASVSHISSYYDKSLGQSLLRIHLNSGRIVKVYESDATDTLEALGLTEFVEDWTLNLERDIG
jgi:hypothetical protein